MFDVVDSSHENFHVFLTFAVYLRKEILLAITKTFANYGSYQL